MAATSFADVQPPESTSQDRRLVPLLQRGAVSKSSSMQKGKLCSMPILLSGSTNNDERRCSHQYGPNFVKSLK